MDGATSMPLHFGDAASEMEAALRCCVLVDRTPFARILAHGPDLLNLLQRLSTADLSNLGPNQGKATVVTSAKGRIVERLFVQHLAPTGVLLCGGPGGPQRLLDHLARYTFAEDTGLEDLGTLTTQLALTGPGAAEALAVKCFRQVKIKEVDAVTALKDCLDDYVPPISLKILRHQMWLAAEEATEASFVPERIRDLLAEAELR